jgi:hypothetical protein
VIDCGIVNKEEWERVEEFRIGERVELDYLPLEISIEGTNHQERGKGRAKKKQRVKRAKGTNKTKTKDNSVLNKNDNIA